MKGEGEGRGIPEIDIRTVAGR
jgi:hypothetical protein